MIHGFGWVKWSQRDVGRSQRDLVDVLFAGRRKKIGICELKDSSAGIFKGMMVLQRF
jgi:hypothetical protein